MCLLIRIGQVTSSIIIALYIAILVSMMEKACTLTYMKELVELNIVTALYTIIYNAQNDGGGVYIDFYEGRSRVEFCNCRILKNIAYLGSGL